MPSGEMVGEQPGGAALTEQTYDEYQGYGWSTAVHPDDAQPTFDAWTIAVRQQQPFLFEHRLRLNDGTRGIFSVRAIPFLMQTTPLKSGWAFIRTLASSAGSRKRCAIVKPGFGT